MDLVLNTLSQHKLYAKESKYEFSKTSLVYLGLIIFVEGVHTNSTKIQAIQEWAVRMTLKKL